MTTSSVFRFNLGEFSCACLLDNEHALNALTTFGGAPQERLEALFGVTEAEPDVAFFINILYVKTQAHQLLVDTGLGKALSFVSGLLPDALRQAGIDLSEIDHVIVTHTHTDHIGGLTDGRGGLTFPNARYTLWRGEWESAIETEARQRLLPIEPFVTLIDGETEVVPGVRVVPAFGHTPYHAAVWVESNGESLLHTVDAMHHPLQVEHSEIHAVADAQPEIAIATRQKLVQEARERDALLMAYHFPFPGVGRLDGSRWHVLGS